MLGTRWCEIIKVAALAGRTDNAIKNRFYSLQRRMRSRQLGAKPTSPLGKRQLGDNECELAPGQRERIVAVATELAFATDEQDRDRLIEELTTALQENSGTDDDQASDLGTLDSPDSLREFGSLAQLDSMPDRKHSLAALLPSFSTGTPSSIRRARPIANIDTSRDSDTAAPPSVPTPASVVLKQQEPSPGYSSAGDSVMDGSTDGSIADSYCTISYSTVVPLGPDGTRVESNSPSRVSQISSPTGVTSVGSSSPGRFSPGEKENVISPMQQKQQQQEEQFAIGASLGGRHAYKALLAPLCIPLGGSDALLGSASPMKRLRTPTGSVTRTCEPYGASSLSAGRSTTAATGTEVPGVKVEPHSTGASGGVAGWLSGGDQPVASPMTELLNLSLFNDLFSDTPCSPPPHSSSLFVAAVPPATRPPITVAPASGHKRPASTWPEEIRLETGARSSLNSPSTPPFPGALTGKSMVADSTSSLSSCAASPARAKAGSAKAPLRCGTEEPALQRRPQPRRSMRYSQLADAQPLASSAGVC